jgi:hypothetical protein
MATDAKTGQPIFGGGHGAGLRSVGSYQVSGHPFITGSNDLDEDKVQMVEFPYVCKSFTVINTHASLDIRVHFQSGSAVTAVTDPGHAGEQTIADTDDVIAGFHYITVPSGDSAVTFDTKCSKFYVSHGESGTATYQVFAELTSILAGSMYHLTGSGVTDTAG